MKQDLGRHRASGKEPGLGLKKLEASLPLGKKLHGWENNIIS